jgi:hypothetical protein
MTRGDTLSLTTISSEMGVRIFSLRSRRHSRDWGGASAEPQEYGIRAHQTREAGGGFLSCAISSSLNQWLSGGFAGLRDKSRSYLGFRYAPPQAICCRPHPRAKNTSKCGLLRENYWADVAIFDQGKVRDRGAYADTHQNAEGAHYVMVNGELVMDEGKIIGKLPGKVLVKSGRRQNTKSQP